MQMKIETIKLEINEMKENKMSVIETVTVQWVDRIKIQLKVTKRKNVN